MNVHGFVLIALALAGACTAKDAETATVSASSGDCVADDPNACPGGQVCDGRTGECVPA